MRPLIKFLLVIIDDVLIGVLVIFLLFYFKVNIWLSGIVIMIFVIILIFAVYIFLPQFKKPVTGAEGMIGKIGAVVETLNPNGTVRISGELWNAESINNNVIGREEMIVVEKIDDLRLLVKKLK